MRNEVWGTMITIPMISDPRHYSSLVAACGRLAASCTLSDDFTSCYCLGALMTRSLKLGLLLLCRWSRPA